MSEKQINHSPEAPAPQEWSNLGVALPRDCKLRLVERAKQRGLKPSQYARTLIIEGMAREDAAA